MSTKVLIKIADFTYDPVVLKEAQTLPEVLGITPERASELLDICSNAYEQGRAAGLDVFDSGRTFITLLESDAFTPKELAFYAGIGFSAPMNTSRAQKSMLDDLSRAVPELKPLLGKAMLLLSLEMMREGGRP